MPIETQNVHSLNLSERRWPLFESFFVAKRLSYLDCLITVRLLKNVPQAHEGFAFFLCYLVAAAREGHLCVEFTKNGFLPDPAMIWKQEETSPLSEGELAQVKSLMREGIAQIPPALITDLSLECPSSPVTPLCVYQNRYYLQRNWMFESLFINRLEQLASQTPALTLDQTIVQERLNELIKDKTLLQEQARAISNGCQYSLSLLVGGPGTGKTYTASQMIKVFWESLTPPQRKKCEIVVAAPTGKAAAQLQRGIMKSTSHLESFPPIIAKTLHSLLKIKSGPSKISADLIIVDEASMIDIWLMTELFTQIKPGARLVLVGDPNQLPSVESGSVFSDLIELSQMKNSIFPSTELKVCLRTELESIVNFASLIRQGDPEFVLGALKEGNAFGVNHNPMDLTKKESQRIFLEQVMSHFPSQFSSEEHPEILLESFQKMRILSPLRKGIFGVEALNEMIGKAYSKKFNRKGWTAIPIMIVSNDYHRNLFNGETGVLIRRQEEGAFSDGDYALFPSHENSSIRKIPAALLPKYEYAYCLSIHKSQGSECDHVVLVMPEGGQIFGRELFYTGVTRARKRVDIYGHPETLSATVQQQNRRHSSIFLRANMSPIA